MKSNATVQNSQIPIDELHEQAINTIIAYLGIANKYTRTESDLKGCLDSFLNHDHDNISEYTNILTAGLFALTNEDASVPFKKAIGNYYFDGFTKILERAAYMLDLLRICDANIAELVKYSLDTNGKHSTDEISNRIYLNNIIRNYKAMATNIIACQADWEVYDKSRGM